VALVAVVVDPGRHLSAARIYSTPFHLTITLDTSHNYALWETLAIARTSTILDSVVGVDIWVYKSECLLSPGLFALVKAIPAMQQLDTIHLSRMHLADQYLHCILSSPPLTHLILETAKIMDPSCPETP
jgi:hypothetical protein